MKDLRELNRFRHRPSEMLLTGYSGPETDRIGGFFFVPVKSSKRPLKIIASGADTPGSQGWDHVSVSLPARCPSWDEMSLIKGLFFHPHETAFQLHPPESEHISNHRYCLHLWRYALADIPMPPSIFVGLKSLGDLGVPA